ncbi:cytochrome P450 98A2 [Artemisia annua]|uniref:Cytochrome P450 98A2 n=1 Tax=Artemisia annua TaxID=35608 RepID=A0A2U1LM68_ARTAN|nr:cytochrome P450 98A2 [Artemisia annua]
MVVEVLAIVVTLIIILYKFTQNLPPGPCTWPIIGKMRQLRPNVFRSLAELSRVYGPIISFRTGSSWKITVSNPQLAKEVLKDNDQQLANRHRTTGIARFSRNGDDLTWADYGPRFVKLKKICVVELFSSKNLETHRAGREEEISIMIESIYSNSCGKGLVLKDYLWNFMFNSITRMIFGKSCVSSDGELAIEGRELKAILEAQFHAKVSLGILEEVWWLRWMSWIIDGENKALAARIHKFFEAVIHERELERENDNNTYPNFLDALLSRRKEYDLSNNTISGLLWDMVSAGIDTSVVASEWGMAELLRNPTVQQRVQKELDNVIGSGEVMTELDIPNLPYLRCVVKETLRLHAPTPLMLPHQANQNLNIGNYNIPKGSRVFVNVWAIGRDQDVWKDPLVFRPERFLEEDVDIKGHDYRLLPFGSGRRVCPGAQLGINLTSLMLGRLLHHFEWSLPEGMRVEEIDMLEMSGIVGYKKIPLEVVPTPRLPTHP